MKIEITSLGQLTHLNTGGEGIVYKCSQYPDKAFKLYKKEVEHEIDLVALEFRAKFDREALTKL